MFGASAAVDGVNVFLRDPNDQPLTYNGTTYVHEAPFGLKTNCITCHKAAAYPADSLGALPQGTRGVYPDWGTLTGSEDLFVGRLQTHFLWGVANKITAREVESATLATGVAVP